MDQAGRERCFVIAEAGVNHDGDLGRARELVAVAAAAGADAVKFQTFAAERLVTADAPKAAYQRRGPEDAETQAALLRRLELDADAHVALRDCAAAHGIEFLSTPYDAASADLLERIGVARFKLASGDLTNLPLLRHVARKGRPVVASTGMATLAEVASAVEALRGAGARDLTLLHCTSSYPADTAECNLRAIGTLRRAFGTSVGYSDHTPGTEIACAAVALGARVIEKHFTLDRRLPGPDHRASLEPEELAQLVARVRAVESALGDGVKRPAASEEEARRLARRSLVAARDLPAGAALAPEDLAARRPARGLPPAALDAVIGRELRAPLRSGEALRWEHLR